ncbi:hypothetical protein SMC26_03695 [Actinomadura fulvescens]|uniref:Methyltransferase n=1 Tax=Actinomadura fulvescens TaxID=46160 RepID=A0ABP6C5P0_9ACTN
MSSRTVAEKLGIKPGHAVHVINAPGDYAQLVGGLPEGAEVTATGPADAVHLFAEGKLQLDASIQRAIDAVRPGGLLWVSYPKGDASDINRDSLWPTFTPYGWRPVRQISVDARWSALRFRPEDDMRGTGERSP